MKIVPATVMADDGGVSDVVSLSRHRHCSFRQHARGAPRETLDLELLGRMMMAPTVPFSLLGRRFGATADWRGQEVVRCCIFSIDGSESRGVALQGLGDGCMMMGVRTVVALSGVMMASTLARWMLQYML